MGKTVHTVFTRLVTVAVIAAGTVVHLSAGAFALEHVVSVKSMQVAFQDAGIRELTSAQGANLLAATESYPACGAYLSVGNRRYGSPFDRDVEAKPHRNGIRYSGVLTDKHGRSPQGEGVSFTADWTVMSGGAIRVRFSVHLPAGTPNGELEYVFPFDHARLPNYWYGGYYVNRRSVCAAADGPLPSFDRDGILYEETGFIHGLNIELTRLGSEAVAVAIERGKVDRVIIERRRAAIVRYRQQYEPGETVESSFYLLPSPVRNTVGMKRIYIITEPDFSGRPVEYLVDRLKLYGFRYLVYHHHWQLEKTNEQRSKNDTAVMFGSHRPRDPEQTAKLIRAAHAAGVKVFGYFGFANEETLTDWFVQQDGERYSTGRAIRSTRRVMCANTPHFQHQLSDAKVMLQDVGFDGLFVDWFTLNGCDKKHPSHADAPASNIAQLVEFVDYVHSMGKELIVHTGEDGNISFFADYADEVAVGERPWSSVTFSSVQDGAFARRSSNAGRCCIQYEPQYYQSEAMAGIAGGLNPFGFITGSLRRRGLEYVLDLMRQVAPYELEAMRVLPPSARAVLSSRPDVASTVCLDKEGCLVFAVSANPSMSTVKAALYPQPDRLETAADAQVVATDLDAKNEVFRGRLSELQKAGIPVRIPANECRVFYIRF
jgi:hypothetical protein